MFNASTRQLADCFRSYIVTNATTSYIVNSVICCVVNLIFFFVGTFLNALVIYVFWKTPTLRFKISYFMIMVLSSIDLLVTSIVHPAHLVMSIAEIVGKPRCAYKSLYHISSIVLSGMSLLTFFVMNIERYLSVVHPMFHLRHVTKIRCLTVCSLFWLPTIFGGPFAYVVNYNGQFILTFAAVVIILGTFYIYAAIFYVARKKKRGLKHTRKTTQDLFIVNNDAYTSASRSTLPTCDRDTHSDTRFQDVKLQNSNTQNLFTSVINENAAENQPSNINHESASTQENTGEKRFEDVELESPNTQNMFGNIVSENTAENQTDSFKHESASTRNKVGDKSKSISFLHDLQLAKMYLLVVFSNIFLNLPNAIGLALKHDRLHHVDGWVQSKIWTVTLVLMSSTVNCLIFFWANERLRKEGKKVYRRMFKR